MTNDLKQFEDKMQERIVTLQGEFARIRAGRANPHILNGVLVDYYGAKTPVDQMASVSVEESRIIVIQPYDITALKEIEKAIHVADLGVSPQNDGKVIRLVFPQLTEERRKTLAKDIASLGENTKVFIRNIRREANDFYEQQEKDNLLTEDDLHASEKEVQELTDKFIKKIEDSVKSKEDEITTV